MILPSGVRICRKSFSSSRTRCDQFRRFVKSVSVLLPFCEGGAPKPVGRWPAPVPARVPVPAVELVPVPCASCEDDGGWLCCACCCEVVWASMGLPYGMKRKLDWECSCKSGWEWRSKPSVSRSRSVMAASRTPPSAPCMRWSV